MIVAILTYKVPLDVVDAHRPAHLDWLNDCLAQGRLLAAGRTSPATGGVIMMRGARAEAEALLKDDPFAIHGVADYDIHEFEPRLVAPGLDALAE
ncbi:MAG: YciI family protein [Sphingobium sp.]|nr:YciI family protein [Sphingobium sp.]